MSILEEFNINFNKKIEQKIYLGEAFNNFTNNGLKTLSGREKIRVKGQNFCISGKLLMHFFKGFDPEN